MPVGGDTKNVLTVKTQFYQETTSEKKSLVDGRNRGVMGSYGVYVVEVEQTLTPI